MPTKSTRGNQSGVDSMSAAFSGKKGGGSYGGGKSVASAKPMKGSKGYKKGY